MSDYTEHPDYEQLPPVIKALYTPEEHAWLGDEERARILERECYPEGVGDDL